MFFVIFILFCANVYADDVVDQKVVKINDSTVSVSTTVTNTQTSKKTLVQLRQDLASATSDMNDAIKQIVADTQTVAQKRKARDLIQKSIDDAVALGVGGSLNVNGTITGNGQ